MARRLQHLARSAAALAVGAGALFVVAIAACPAAPPPRAGAAAGSACTTDLVCADGLVCTCGTCATPGDVDEPPICSTAPTGCTPFPTACVQTCDDQVFVGMATCVDGDELCEVGVLASACPLCIGPLPAGFICSSGDAVCAVPAVTGCATDCDESPFTCVPSCDAGAPFSSTCVDGAQACDAVGAVPEASCPAPDAGIPADAGTDDAGADDAGEADAGVDAGADPADAGDDAGG